MSTPDPTVFVIDDDHAVRESLRALAESVGYPVETFGSAQDFLDSYAADQPGCLVLDVRMRGMSGLELQAHLAERGIMLPVIIVTGHGDIPMAVRAMRSGAVDFIEKPYRDQVLLDRIQQAIERDVHLRRIEQTRREIQQRLDRLTSREREVLERIMDGKTNREIAEELGVSVRSVESHRGRVMERMHAGSVVELTKMVVAAAIDGNDLLSLADDADTPEAGLS